MSGEPPITPAEEYHQLITTQILLVRDLRLQREADRAQNDAILLEFQRLNRSILDAHIQTKTALTVAEEALRQLTLDAYYANPEKKQPGPGVGIRVVSLLIYDADEALAWAVKHEMAVKLDKAKFEALAKVDTPDFVEFQDDVVPTITTDISKALGLPPEGGPF